MRQAFLSCLLLVFGCGPAISQSIGSALASNPACELPPVKKTLPDWSDVARYREDNQALETPMTGKDRVVFFGSSTTDNWGRRFDSQFFPGEPYINRGISGETTPQMLLRFQQDVVALKPAAVVFLGGTNDIAGNTGIIPLETTEANIASMVAIAKANGIKMILASQLPVTQFPWNRCMHPEKALLSLTAWEHEFAVTQHLGYVDYYSLLVSSDGSFRAGLSPDGVHPNKKAYDLMSPVVEREIKRVLNTR